MIIIVNTVRTAHKCEDDICTPPLQLSTNRNAAKFVNIPPLPKTSGGRERCSTVHRDREEHFGAFWLIIGL